MYKLLILEKLEGLHVCQERAMTANRLYRKLNRDADERRKRRFFFLESAKISVFQRPKTGSWLLPTKSNSFSATDTSTGSVQARSIELLF